VPRIYKGVEFWNYLKNWLKNLENLISQNLKIT
jgi:hypothetical protein